MDSFYGGQAGQDFTIAYIFTSKYGETESLKSDLLRGWQSLIPVASIVAISYGLPADGKSYNDNKQIDIDVDHRSYNATLWRKEYNEEGEAEGNGEIYTLGNGNGLRYRMIASMSANTPSFNIEVNNDLSADAVPKVKVDNSNPDNPSLEFSFPKEQLIQLGNVNLTGPNGRVDVELDTSNIDKPTLNFWLSQSQKFEKTKVVWVDAGTPDVPSVEILLSGEEGATDLTPVLKFTLPKTPVFLAGNITSTEVDANVLPSVSADMTNPNEPKIKFSLPQAQVFQKPIVEVVDPTSDPNVTLNSSDINKPVLEFELPRAVEFYYGTLIGARNESGIEETNEEFADYGLGDYYVNIPTGYIYKVVGKSGNTVTFDFVACLQTPKPEVGVTPIAPFKSGEEGFVPNTPTVKRTVQPNGWQLQFGLPQGPNYTIDDQLAVAPLDQASVSAEITDENTLKFSFRIPRGSRAFTGMGVPEDIPESGNGDCYLDGNTGDIYRLEEGVWENKGGNIRGPIGKALTIVADYDILIGSSIPGHDNLQNNIADGVAYIEYMQPEKEFSPEELYAISWLDEYGNETGYWQYYVADGTWGRMQITSNGAGFLASTYREDDNKAYNTTYINTLITSKPAENKERTTYSQSAIEELISWGKFSDLIT